MYDPPPPEMPPPPPGLQLSGEEYGPDSELSLSSLELEMFREGIGEASGLVLKLYAVGDEKKGLFLVAM